jgi:lipoyl(octanoyl) transferase
MNYIVVKLNEKISYSDGLELQHKVYDLVENDVYDGVLLILEHKHVLSMGIRSNYDNLLVSKELLKEKDVELYETDRGGDITYHGPGQIVAYPIVKLKKLKLRLSDYMHNLEKVVIDTLSTHNLNAYQRDDYPGVWIDNTKICAIGVRARKYITYHGLAYNVATDKSYFNLINPMEYSQL